jgi:hypothetical protein
MPVLMAIGVCMGLYVGVIWIHSFMSFSCSCVQTGKLVWIGQYRVFFLLLHTFIHVARVSTHVYAHVHARFDRQSILAKEITHMCIHMSLRLFMHVSF